MTQNHRNYSEKRDFIRMHVNAPVTLFKDGLSFAGTCLDLSSTGMQVEAATSLQLGCRVRVAIPSEHDELSGLDAEAEVVRVESLADGRQSLGLAILSMS